METNLSLYECQGILNDIEALAQANEGEIPEDKLQLLVQVQTTSMIRLEKLVGYIKFLEHRTELCKIEEQRIAAMRQRAEKHLESVKQFLVPFVATYRTEKGHPLDVGTFTLSTRKNEAVEINDVSFAGEENRKKWCTEKVTYSPDKAKMKAALKAGTEIAGATLVTHESLQVK